MPHSVSDIMTRDVVTVTMDDDLAWVRDIFDTKKFQHLVVTEQGRVVGVISDRDLLKNLSPFIGKMAERSADTASLRKKVHQVMSRDLIWARPTTSLRKAARYLAEHHVSCLPILQLAPDHQEAAEPTEPVRGRCIGIVTVTDVLEWMVEFIACDVEDEEDQDPNTPDANAAA
ncbi:MAG: CBS domain-containing protein [Planctomycetota bacterium]